MKSGFHSLIPIIHPYNVRMIQFEWNPEKASSNAQKHGVSFEEAKSVFYDEFAV